MNIDVTVIPVDPRSDLPPGTPVHIEVRDVSLQDIAARVVATTDTTSVLADDPGAAVPNWSASATVDVPDDIPRGSDVTVFVRVAASGKTQTAAGDLLTVRSFPLTVPDLPDAVTVTVERIQ